MTAARSSTVHADTPCVCNSLANAVSAPNAGPTSAQNDAPYVVRYFAASTTFGSVTIAFALPVLHSSITRYPSGPSGASRKPSGASYPPTCVAAKPSVANSAHTAVSKSAGSKPVAVVRTRSSAASDAAVGERTGPDVAGAGHGSGG